MENDYKNIEIYPVYSNIMVQPYVENPYKQKTTESGLKLTAGQFDNPDTGERDEKEFFIATGKVIAAGPACKYVKEGDDVMFDERAVRPVPFFDSGFLILAEPNVVCVIGPDLKKRFEED